MGKQMTAHEIKMAMANAIFSQPETRPFNFGAIDGAKSGIIDIKFIRQSNLSTQIRVRTQHCGTIFYTLKLSEHM